MTQHALPPLVRRRVLFGAGWRWMPPRACSARQGGTRHRAGSAHEPVRGGAGRSATTTHWVGCCAAGAATRSNSAARRCIGGTDAPGCAAERPDARCPAAARVCAAALGAAVHSAHGAEQRGAALALALLARVRASKIRARVCCADPHRLWQALLHLRDLLVARRKCLQVLCSCPRLRAEESKLDPRATRLPWQPWHARQKPVVPLFSAVCRCFPQDAHPARVSAGGQGLSGSAAKIQQCKTGLC